MSRRYSRRTKEYFAALLAVFFLLLVSGILLPIIEGNLKSDWEQILVDKIDSIENSVFKTFDKKSAQIVACEKELKGGLRTLFKKDTTDFNSIIGLFASPKYNGFSIQLYDSTGLLFAWNSEQVFNKSDIRLFGSSLGQTFFGGHKLLNFLSTVDTVRLNKTLFYLTSSLLVEKNYSLNAGEEENYSVKDSLSDVVGTALEIRYSPYAQRSKDVRKHSYQILNNYKNKIGVAVFDKPSLETELDNYGKLFGQIQNVLLLIIVLVLGFYITPEISRIRKTAVRFVIIAAFILLIRALLFLLGIPSSFIHNALTDSSNFSSVFAFGIVRSPLELTFSIISILIILLIGYRYTTQNDGKQLRRMGTWGELVCALLVSLPIYMLGLRGLGASIRSVIFDSSIHYFKVFSLVPDPPAFLMDLNILLLSLGTLIFSIIVILQLFRFSPLTGDKKRKGLFYLMFFLFQIAGELLDLAQSEPQGTPLIRATFIALSFVFSYILIFGKGHRTVFFVYYAFASSVISVALLGYYNSEIERESLKTTARELTRTNENVVEFMIYQIVDQASQSEDVIESMGDGNDLSPLAFRIWMGSLFYREGVRSALKFYDAGKKYIGGFQTTNDFSKNPGAQILTEPSDSLKIERKAGLYGDEITFTGTAAVKSGKEVIGYIFVSAIYDEDYFNFSYLPKFLISGKTGISSALDLGELEIFDFHDNELVRSFGGTVLSYSEKQRILDSDFSVNNEAWIKMSISDENHLVYALKIESPLKTKILAVALGEKQYAWSLSNFFKIFFIHTILIFLAIVIYFVFRFKKDVVFFSSYRSRLIGAFLVVSIVPLVVIALYFRNLTEEKNSDLMDKRLDELTGQVTAYLNYYTNASNINLNIIFDKALNDLGINFSVYNEEKLIYTPQQNFVDTGLLPSTMDVNIYRSFFLGKNQKLFIQETFDGSTVNSVYSKFGINGDEYVIGINNLFNKISFPISDVELNFFLFGIFSLTILLLIVLSALLAGQISSPIRKLTRATKSVGIGDYTIKIDSKERGEIGELVEGFNQMVAKIRQSQSDIALLEREAAWKEMARQVAHEIKNPLTPMKLSIQQLIAAYRDKSAKFDAIFEKVTATIAAQIEILKNIASEFSNFARMPRINIKRFDLSKAIDEVITLFADERRPIRLHNTSGAVQVKADEEQLKRMIINLFRNAIQAGAEIIDVDIIVKEGNCEIRVSDNGSGIDSGNIERVFDENFTTKEQGMGLGLSMAKRYVESIEGNISVEKSTTDGTTILIKIPVAD